MDMSHIQILSIYLRINYNNCHVLSVCYVLYTLQIWFVILTKHLWNRYHYLHLLLEKWRIVGIMKLAQVHPVWDM